MTEIGLNRQRIQILGIVNITEDSFSDGGLFLDSKAAVEQSERLIEAGGDIIDLGAVSSNPSSRDIPASIEIERLAPVIHELKRKKIPISVDTFSGDVQKFCAEEDVDYINDIQGFPLSEVYETLAGCQSRLIVMHSVQRIGRATIEYTNPESLVENIDEFFEDRIQALVRAGISRERLILDPGMGFFLGSNPEASITALNHLSYWKEKFQLPLLVSVSRKSFLGVITNRPVDQRGPSTLSAELYAALQGVDFIRTHDTAALHDALLIQESLRKK